MKSGRHEKIAELIRRYEIETQEELADRLNKEGYKVTQATVSRDIRALGLVKEAAGDGRQRYVAPKAADDTAATRYAHILKDGFVSADEASGILVIKTAAGMAMAVAAAIDDMDMNEIVGCIAGDDTIMCAIRSGVGTESVLKKLKEIVS